MFKYHVFYGAVFTRNSIKLSKHKFRILWYATIEHHMAIAVTALFIRVHSSSLREVTEHWLDCHLETGDNVRFTLLNNHWTINCYIPRSTNHGL